MAYISRASFNGYVPFGFMPLGSVFQSFVGRLTVFIFTVRPGFAWQGL